MNRIKFAVLLFVAVLFGAVPSFAQQITPPVGEVGHVQGGVYFSAAYAGWQGRVLSGNSTTGAGSTIVVQQPGALPDGYSIPLSSIFPAAAPFVPVQITDANPEVIVPTAVSAPSTCPTGAAGPINSQCVTITANIANSHGVSAFVSSGDSGIMEAITDAGANGGGLVYWTTDTGSVTLNTGGLTTTTTAKIPTQFVNMGASARVTTTITTSANWSVGAATTGASAICTANSTLTAGTTCIANQTSTVSLSGTTNALQAITFTMGTSNPGAGAVKARVWGWTPVQSTI